jgi:hypothetical protein
MISTSTFTSVPIESGLDLILSHSEKPYFPRRISTDLTEKNPPWQISVNSRDEALAKCKESNLLNCRISAYPFPVPTVRGINSQVPNFFMSDLDRKNFKTGKSLQECLQHTLKNFKDKLRGANPTVLWSGGGYHILQPLDADVILEMESIFSELHEPSRNLMRYAEKLMTDNKADPVHSSTVSFNNCMIRIPGSYNTKYIQFDKGEIVNILPQSEVKIVQRWDGYKPNIKWLLRDYWMYLIQAKNNEVLANLRKDQKRLCSQWRKGIEPSQQQQQKQQTRQFSWIELLYRKPIRDFRKYCIWRIFVPYFINIRRLSELETENLVSNWLDRCNIVERLNFDARRKIRYALGTVKNFLPIGQDQLRMEYDGRLYSLLKMEGVIH